MVGAGGIGCELLKDLVLSGFGEIHVVDLDTITLLNLNRQFLFRQKDIDKSKSLTVTKAVQQFNYLGAKLVAHHGNIMNTAQFSVEWWRQFDYVFNALDNLEARRYVNRMALFLHKPLMESGTTGFDGQIQPIFPYSTECFECLAKVTPKTYPVCTIRSTPSQPVHCITWAKEFVFKQLFDEAGDDTTEQSLQGETDNKQEIDAILKELNELAELRHLVASGDSSFARRLVTKLFKVDVERSLRLELLWKNRTLPVALNIDQLWPQAKLTKREAVASDTKVWLVVENLTVLVESAQALQRRVVAGESIILFDKDDEDTLRFVGAAANLRCLVFSIEVKSLFDIKQIAGNIIPAIATTNAIISGLANISSFKYFSLANPPPSSYSTVFISIKPNKYLTGAGVMTPNPQCAACGLSSKAVIQLSSLDLTLQAFIDEVTRRYGYTDISVIVGESRLVYDPDFDDNVEKSLAEVGIANQQVVLIQDEDDELENIELLVVVGDTQWPEVALRPKKVVQAAKTILEDSSALEGNNEPIVVDDEPTPKRRKVEVL